MQIHFKHLSYYPYQVTRSWWNRTLSLYKVRRSYPRAARRCPRLLVMDDKGGQDSCHVEHHDLRTVIHYMARVACFAWFSVAPVGGRERRWLTCSHARKKVIRQMKNLLLNLVAHPTAACTISSCWWPRILGT